jgi:type IV secretory pathway VirB10-like protein
MKDYAEPHFDDERTLLSARPVVPLQKIEAKVRHRRQWFLGGAFAVAMMLGAATALVASYLKHRNVPQAAVESSIAQPEVAPAPVAAAVSSPSDTPAVENQPTEESAAETTTPKLKRRVVRARPNPEPDEDTTNMSEHDQLNRIRDAVLYDEWQERRARRAMRRDRRQDRYNHRDLSDLNEIFEGRRRP